MSCVTQVSSYKKSIKRFKKGNSKARPFAVQDDDFAILYWVLKRRLLTSHQIRALFPHRSSQTLGRRLRTLLLSDWIDKPEHQSRLWAKGSMPHIIAPSKEGCRQLSAHRGIEIPDRDWKNQNAKMREHKMRELLMVSEFMVDVECSARLHEQITYRDAYELLSVLDLPRSPKPKAVVVPEVKWQGYTSKRGIEPDELLSIIYHNREDAPSALFVVEIDNETETIVPSKTVRESASFWRSSSILKKNVIYASAFKNKKYRLFTRNVFRVLYVTNTPGHMKEMIKCERDFFSTGDLAVRPGLFLYANQELIAEHKADILAMSWIDRDGRVFQLHQ